MRVTTRNRHYSVVRVFFCFPKTWNVAPESGLFHALLGIGLVSSETAALNVGPQDHMQEIGPGIHAQKWPGLGS